jgi:hypothetical protein
MYIDRSAGAAFRSGESGQVVTLIIPRFAAPLGATGIKKDV